MATRNLFDNDDAAGEESDDSFIADSEAESDGSLASVRGAAESADSDFEFLFGSAPKQEPKKTKKTASKWQKELDRRMREASAQYADIENVESEVAFNLEHLSAHFERRQGVESEMLTLFSGLLTREQFTVDSTSPSNDASKAEDTAATQDASQETDRALNKLMKKLIRSTFRGKTPEGRFGNLVKPNSEAPKPSVPGKVSTVVSIGREALSNLQDLNTLLSREREGDYMELDGVPLYKHTRYGTLYVFESGFVTTHLIPLCSKLLHEASSNDHDFQALTQEVLYLLYQLSQPPSSAWYNYWTEAQPHYKAFAVSKEYDHDPNVASELKRRARIVFHYLNGLVALRSSLMSSDLWTLIGEFRMKLENFERAGHRTPEQKQRVEMLQRQQDSLANERDALLAEAADSDDDEDEKDEDGHTTGRGRLRKDRSTAEARKKRVQEIRNQLYEVNDELAKERQAHMEAQQQTRIHCKTVRLLITHTLTIPGDGLGLLCMLQEGGLISLLRDEVVSCFNLCKRGFTVSESDDIHAHPAYLSEAQRESLWEYVRLVHAILVCVDVNRFLGLAYTGIRPAEMQVDDVLLRSTDEQADRSVDNEAILDLIRLNPKLARMTLRGPANLGKFTINERFQGTRSHASYEHWFRFPSLTHLQTPFEVSSGVSNSTSGSRVAASFSAAVVKALQSEVHQLIGIDADFEHCHWSDAAAVSGIYYELGLLLSMCFGDLMREAQDRYYQQSDYQVVLDLHTWVVTYYRCMYLYLREQCRVEEKQAPPEAYVLLALRRYIGADSSCAKVACAYVWQLIRKHSLSKASHFGATSALRALFADLNLFHMLDDIQSNVHVMSICQETLAAYFTANIRAILFWILRYFKLLSQPVNLFCFALANLHLLRRVVRDVGSVSFTQENSRYDSVGRDSDSDFSDDGSSITKTVIVTADSVFSSRNRNTANDDILYNGRVVYNCVAMLANFRTNSPHLNDMLVTHLETVPLPILYDIKYFYVFRDIVGDRRVWQNAKWRWIGDYCVRVMESFFDSWLGRGNRFLPLELFFNKCSPATKGPFRPCAPDNIAPIIRGYEHCGLLTELLQRPEATVYEVVREKRGVTGSGAWDPEEDAALLKYHKQFRFLADPVAYIAELLGRREADVQRRLQELRVPTSEPKGAKGGNTSALQKLLRNLVSLFADEAIKVCAELHENISESMEMQRLGGEDAVCEVMEPLSASPRLLESAEFQAVLHCLGISQNWLLPKNTAALGPLMAVLDDPSSYIVVGKERAESAEQSTPEARATATSVATGEPIPEDTHMDMDAGGYEPAVVTSKDIAELVLGLIRCLEEHSEPPNASDIIQSAINLVESASVVGRAEAVCNYLPQREECLSHVRGLLRLAEVEVRPPMIACDRLPNAVIAVDRLRVAINLSRLPANRLEMIVQAHVQQPTVPSKRPPSSMVMDTDFEDSFEKHVPGAYDDPHEDHLDLDAPVDFNIFGFRPGRGKKKGTSQRSVARSGAGTVDNVRRKTFTDSDGLADTPVDHLITTPDEHGGELRAVLDELRRRLLLGHTRIDAADLMGTGIFDNWDSAFDMLRRHCGSLGAAEEFVNNTLWLVWPHDNVDSAVTMLSATPTNAIQPDDLTSDDMDLHPIRSAPGRRKLRRRLDQSPPVFGVQCQGEEPAPIDLESLERLEVNPDLVTSIYEESLRLAREGRLQNTVASREDLERLLDVNLSEPVLFFRVFAVQLAEQVAGHEVLPERVLHWARGYVAQVDGFVDRHDVGRYVEQDRRNEYEADQADPDQDGDPLPSIGDVVDLHVYAMGRHYLLEYVRYGVAHHAGHEPLDADGPEHLHGQAADVAQRADSAQLQPELLHVATAQPPRALFERFGVLGVILVDVLDVSNRHLNLNGERRAEHDHAAAELQHAQRAFHVLRGFETQRQQDVAAVLPEHPHDIDRLQAHNLRVMADERARGAKQQHRHVSREYSHTNSLLGYVVPNPRLGRQGGVYTASHNVLVHAGPHGMRPYAAASVKIAPVQAPKTLPEEVGASFQRDRRECLRIVTRDNNGPPTCICVTKNAIMMTKDAENVKFPMPANWKTETMPYVVTMAHASDGSKLSTSLVVE
ncbi:Pb-reticulocyte binding protein, putative [Babesia ovata]|uniref:Pb-reticulocyte binding protein, putative n=1 Tax=Babesia ovata TaxID=189622 RepID=A0A2H6KA82_9APIC|nr:Pb-reticulocyte binding protein, putative [Babesia ovata]GBE59907.1 Pb-reticulocyte binding protein, putative [Babesia ovata]